MSENTNAMMASPSWATPTTMEQAMQVAKMFAASDFVPAAHKGKPGNIIVAMQVAHSLGAPLLPVLQNIAVINGRPSLWGDFALALVKRHAEFEDIEETLDMKSVTAVCTIKRRGQTPTTRQFSKTDAERAGLWKKAGPWTQYTQRMLQMRARSWAMRDSFPDALAGLSIAEEAQDMPPVRAEVVASKSGVSAVKAALGIAVEPVEPEDDMPNPEPAEMPPEIDDTPVYGDPTDATMRDQVHAAFTSFKVPKKLADALCVEVTGRKETGDGPYEDEECAKILDAIEARFGGGS